MSVALVIQHSKRMRRIMLSSVARPDLQYFSTFFPINGTIFGENFIKRKMFVLIFCITLLKHFSF
jgi:hypothetical protein